MLVLGTVRSEETARDHVYKVRWDFGSGHAVAIPLASGCRGDAELRDGVATGGKRNGGDFPGDARHPLLFLKCPRRTQSTP